MRRNAEIHTPYLIFQAAVGTLPCFHRHCNTRVREVHSSLRELNLQREISAWAWLFAESSCLIFVTGLYSSKVT